VVGECRAQDSGWLAAATASLVRILVELVRHYGRLAGQAHRSLLELAAAESWIDQHLARPLQVAEIAEAAHLGERSLQRLFRRELGCAVMDYVTRRRLERAAEALRESGRPVAEIAAACGFPNAAWFAQRFRREYGRTPRAWRRLG